MGHEGRRRFLFAACALLAAPSGVRAQQKPIRLGVLTQVDTTRTPHWEPFFRALSKRGWREGHEYVLDVREGRGDPAVYLKIATEFVRDGADIVLAITTAPAVALKKVSSTLPVVTLCGYPVEAGLVASLARPGGNVTGISGYAAPGLWGKYLQLMRELKPGVRELAILWDYAPPAFPDGFIPLPLIEGSAKQLGIRTRLWMLRSTRDLDAALPEIERGPIDALLVTAGGGVLIQPASLASVGDILKRRRLPAITDYAGTVFLKGGCTLAYSPNTSEIFDRLAYFIDRILRGASPGDLPFEYATVFDLAVNLKSARDIGLTIPRSMLLRADRIIE